MTVAASLVVVGLTACSPEAEETDADRKPALPVTSGSIGADPGRGTDVGPPTRASRVAPPHPLELTPSTGSGWFGVKGSLGQPATRPYVASLPSARTFAEIEWCDVEPTPGLRTWERLDRVIDEAHRLGHRIMLKLRTGTCWGTTAPSAPASLEATVDVSETAGKAPSTRPLDLDRYLRHVAAVVDHARTRGVHAYAIENETDVVSSWASGVAAYDALVRAVVPIVRAHDPAAHVLDSGISSTSYGVVLAARRLARGDTAGALATYRTHYSRRQDGGASRWPRVDTVAELRAVVASSPGRRSVASFRVARRLVADRVVDAWQLHAYEAAPALQQVLRLLDRALPDRSTVEAWEVGVAWPGRPGARAIAVTALRATALLVASGVRRLVFLPVAWTPSPRPQVFHGLAEADGSVKPVGRTWAALARAFDGVAPGSVRAVGAVLRATPTRDVVGVRWRASGRTWAILWSTRGRTAPPWPLDRVVTAGGASAQPGRSVGRSPVLARLARR